ncbi:hypothetical protein QUF80_08875 [Desulfococcaceae bacterium HSG8]|nr:hypothetical protein [Desulfococcaceae bacterium HSG8]
MNFHEDSIRFKIAVIRIPDFNHGPAFLFIGCGGFFFLPGLMVFRA